MNKGNLDDLASGKFDVFVKVMIVDHTMHFIPFKAVYYVMMPI